MAIFNALAAAAAAAGLEYETGTYQPTTEEPYYDIAFSNTHTEPPAFVFACINKADNVYFNSTASFLYVDTLAFLGGQINSTVYGMAIGTAGTSYSIKYNITTRYNNTTSTHSQAAAYYISSTGFKPRYPGDGYNWSTSYPIKWIAIWPLYH